MSEKEIRTIIQRVREELDRRARKLIYPSLLGAGLALTGCSDTAVPMYGLPPRDAAVDHKTASEMNPLYAVPDSGSDLKKIDSGVTTPYSVPAPDGAAKVDKSGVKLDGGGVSLYAVPAPDGSK
jgi:hypothetical protein